ncbi:hypothetical protein CAPTEDRAFT_212926 [Capitella teleta]|uniref:Cyclic nucleotide-binding domain-containing protein n=1 Tax=Capitella teleta TaxID=283909 RepID=R7TPF3_CAPTE|nr:hypothetical protein CAPTEDRAFT_212926 [Capitella teleta]|eukprot:ELT93381.1 hypothetical protein CAPTEDRAFT_212926 [Capitella teleta]
MATLTDAERLFLGNNPLDSDLEDDTPRTCRTECRRPRKKKRVQKKKYQSHENLPDIHKDKHTLGKQDIEPVCDLRKTSFPRVSPVRKQYNSQFSLGNNRRDQAEQPMGPAHSSSAPAGLNIPEFDGFLPALSSILSAGTKTPSRASEVDSERDGSSRFQRALAHAEEEIKHNWLLESEKTILMKKFSRRKHQLTICVPDEDPMVSISKRMEEIQMMTKPRRDERYVLDRIDPVKSEIILKYKHIPVEQIRKVKRQVWRARDKFHWAANMVRLLLNSFRHSTKYFEGRNEPSAPTGRLEFKANLQPEIPLKSSLGSDLQLCLTTPAYYRTDKMITKILWLLRALKPFRGLFPIEMEEEVARHVAYERYNDGRLVGYQGRPPDRFYFILSGRLSLLRQFKLTTGYVTKIMGTLTKGVTSDPEELERQWLREDSFVARGQVEVLLIDKKIFTYLQHTTVGPPIEFLRSLDLFEDFPVEQFLQHPDAIEYIYYGFVCQTYLHATREYPFDHNTQPDTKNPFSKSIGCKSPLVSKIYHHPEVKVTVKGEGDEVQEENRDPELAVDEENATPVTAKEAPEQNVDGAQGRSEVCSPTKSVKFLPDLTNNNGSTSQAPRTQDVHEVNAHPLWLTRERTDASHMLPEVESGSLVGRKRTKEQAQRKTFLQLDQLNTGDVFGLHTVLGLFAKDEGLDHLQPALASEARGFSLVSDGAEVIKISKRFFLQLAGNNTMLKVEMMYKDYLSEREAREALYDQETWDQYKDALWKRMVHALPATR